MRKFIDIVESFEQGRSVNEILYHGSSVDFDSFETGRSNGWSKARMGFYLTDDYDVAREFFGNVSEWQVNLTNAADFEHGNGSDIVKAAIEIEPSLQDDLDAVRRTYGEEMEDTFLASRFASRGYLQTNEFIIALKKMGYDGMIFDDLMSQTPFTSYVIFEPQSARRIK